MPRGHASGTMGSDMDALPIRQLTLVLDLAGTFVFAISGAMQGVRHRLDLFGVLVLSFVAANGGGVMRATMIGATPPAALQDWRYVAIMLATAPFAGSAGLCKPRPFAPMGSSTTTSPPMRRTRSARSRNTAAKKRLRMTLFWQPITVRNSRR